MSRLQSSRKQRRELQFACNVVAIKNEFKIILGTLNPVSTLNYLHYEGIVVSKEDFERHLSTSETNIGIGRRTDSVSSVEESKNPDDKWQQAAREKLTEIVDKKDEHKELRAIMIGLNPFKKLHQSAVDRRQTFQSPGIDIMQLMVIVIVIPCVKLRVHIFVRYAYSYSLALHLSTIQASLVQANGLNFL